MRYKPHTLSGGEEKLLAMQSEMAHTADRIFRQLTDADMKFGMIRDDKGQKSNSERHVHPVPALRGSQRPPQRVPKFYAQFQGQRIRSRPRSPARCRKTFTTKARSYASAREASLFHDNVPVSVYDNLIASVQANLPACTTTTTCGAGGCGSRTSITTTFTCPS